MTLLLWLSAKAYLDSFNSTYPRHHFAMEPLPSLKSFQTPDQLQGESLDSRREYNELGAPVDWWNVDANCWKLAIGRLCSIRSSKLATKSHFRGC